MRVVVAGAAGFIGCHLAKRYLDDGCEVVGVDNLVTGDRRNAEWLSREKGFTFIQKDTIQPVDVDGPVDLVCDLACPASPVDFAPLSVEIMRVCSEGVLHLLELALKKKAVFLHTSTSEVYGDPEVHPQKEDYWGHVNPIGARSVYDEGKRYAEALITAWGKRHGTPVRISRIFNTYGPRMRLDDGRVVTNFICQALTGKPLTIYGDGSQTRSFCYIDDQVEGQVLLAKSDYPRPVNIGNPEEITVRQLAEEVIELTGSTSKIISEPMPPDDPKLRRPDISLAQKLLGWRPRVDRREGLRRTVEYCRQLLGEPKVGTRA
jgi:dTDP-glucose 4,6-dehydratase